MFNTENNTNNADNITEEHDYINPQGNLNIIVTDEFGTIKENIFTKNLVVTTGKNWIAGRLKDTGGGHTIPAQMSYMEIGTDTSDLVGVPVVVGQTTLTTPLVRVALNPAGGEVVSNVVTYTATFPPNGAYIGAITEAGIFNASSAGTMLCRTKFLPVNKAAADTMTIIWSVTAT